MSEDESLDQDVSWIYIRGPAKLPPRTLSLEIYLKDSRPKVELEIYAQHRNGGYVPILDWTFLINVYIGLRGNQGGSNSYRH